MQAAAEFFSLTPDAPGPDASRVRKNLCSGIHPAIVNQVSEYLVDHRRVFDAVDYFDETGAFATNTGLFDGLVLWPKAEIATDKSQVILSSAFWAFADKPLCQFCATLSGF
jgi:hypothetical protein